MKKKQYVYIAVVFLLMALWVFFYGLSTAGIFNKHKIIVRAISCADCPTHQVIFGSSKLTSQLPDSADMADVSKIFLTGQPNPGDSDYTKTYNYFLVTGKLIDVKRTVQDGAQYPVVSVSTWEEFNGGNGWPFGLAILALLYIGFRFYRAFLNANRVSVLKSSIMSHEDIPD